MLKQILSLVLILASFSSYSQVDKAFIDSFYRKIKSVKYADLGITDNGIKLIISRGASESSDVIAIKEYVLEELKLYGAFITPEDREIGYLNCNSITEIVQVSWKVGVFQSELGAIGNYPFTIVFSFADKSEFKFSFPVNVSGLTMSMPKAILRGLKKTIGAISSNALPSKINLNKGEILFSENELNTYFNSPLEKYKIEGFYKLIKGTASIDKLAIAQKNGKLYMVNIQNKYFLDDWEFGEIRGKLEPTMGKSVFTGNFYLIDKQAEDIVLTVKEDNVIELSNPAGGESMIFVRVK